MKKHLLSLVLIVAFVFAFIPRTFAIEVSEPVLNLNESESAVDETININEESDSSSETESEDEEEKETTSQENEIDEEENSESENSDLETSNDQEEENENIEEGNNEEVTSNENNEEVVEVTEEAVEVTSNENDDDENDSDNYEVTFTREGYRLVIPGGKSILLSQLNPKLGINVSLSEIENVTISNQEVLSIVKVEDDYKIQSLKSFQTEEELIIKTTDGYEYVVKVVDPVNQIPEHDKELINNEDGTYTIELTVVGDSEKQITKVNVIVVLDTSNSMDTNTGNQVVTYTPTNSTGSNYYQNNLYGYINGNYVVLERRVRNGNRTFWYNGVQYTGQRYTRVANNQNRLQAAQEAVNSIAQALLSNNGANGNPTDTVEMALIDFNANATTRITSTTNYTEFSNAVNRLSVAQGTNWEAALARANEIDFNDNDRIYVIFVSDGNPSVRVSADGYTQDQRPDGQYGIRPIGATPAGYEERAYNASTDEAQAIVSSGKNFYTIGAYGNVDRMEDLTTTAGAPANHYYNAADTAALQEALNKILEEIEMAGIGAVSISDGTTNNVTTSSGVSSLLDVDETSFKYYKDGVEWADAPKATLNSNGEVVWDLNEVGVLDDGVEYKVTFVVWPSQTTLDLIADLKNDPSKYDTLDANIKKYLLKDGDSYTLLTNTTASLSFTDTRAENPQPTSTIYENPNPVSTSATQMLTITKKWNNEIDEREKGEVKINVLRDGKSWNTLTLNNGNNYEISTNIAVGIMTEDSEGNYEIKATGHDFSFGELGDEAYNWELKSEVVHPMLINGELTILKRYGTEKPESGKYYLIDDYYYTVGELEEGVAKLIATNERRSWIDITKTVNYGNAAPLDEVFTFEITVEDKEGKDVWFSIKVSNDADAAFATEEDGLVVTGATAESGNTGYYIAASNSLFTVKIKVGWNIRIINLLTGTKYTIKETDIDSKFEFEEIKYLDTTYENEDGETVDYEPTIEEETVSGEIMRTNVKYGYEFINKNVGTEVTVTKVWDDNDNKAEARPEKVVVYLYANGEEIDSVELSEENEWTHTFTDLPVYEDDEEIEYTVDEQNVAGYDKSVSGSQKDGFTITNEFIDETGDTEPPITGVELNNNNNSIVPFMFLVLLLILEGICLRLNKQN